MSPLGDRDTQVRKRSDQILKHVITPVIESMGYAPAIRSDSISEPGIITNQIIEHLVQDDLVIADLTDRNPNVFYELAIRHAVRKPFVHLARSSQDLPFDVAGMRAILIKLEDPDSVEEAKIELRKQIAAAEKNPNKVLSPISQALNLNPEAGSQAKLLQDIWGAVDDMRSVLLKIPIEVQYLQEAKRRAQVGPKQTAEEESKTISIKAPQHLLTNLISLGTFAGDKLWLGFSAHGLTFRSLDDAHVSLTEIFIPSVAFTEYRVPYGDKTVAIDNRIFSRILERSTNKDNVQMIVGDAIALTLTGAYKREWTIPTMVSSNPLPSPKASFSAKLVLTTKGFKEVIDHLLNTTDHVTFSATNENFRASSIGEEMLEITLERSNNAIIALEVGKNAKATYSIAYLKEFMDHVETEKMTLEYANKSPLRISLEPIQGGHVNFWLAPRIEEK